LKTICLRIDDIGASTKQFEQYSKKGFGLGNILGFKRMPWFKAWGPYDELTSLQWESLLDMLTKKKVKLTVGITACWVTYDGDLIPFQEKYPEQADLLKFGSESGLLEIANHGLTHCIVGKHLPRMFASNRKYHREFWEWIPRDIHFEHLEKSQKIFHDWLGVSPSTLIPPGNVYSVDTLEAAEKNGITLINSYIDHGVEGNVQIVNSDQVDAFHDRELVLDGLGFLEHKLNNYPDDTGFVFLREF